MKLFVIYFMALVGLREAHSQFQFPSFQLPSPFQGAAPSLPSLPSGIPNPFNISDQFPQFNIDQLFNSSATNFMQSFPISSFIKDFSSLLNTSSFQNFLPPPGFRQSSSDFDSVPESLRQSFQGAFELLGKAVNSSLSQGLASIEKAFHGLNGTALSITLLAETVVSQTIQDIENRINRYNETVRTCIHEHISKYEEILPEARDGSIECIQNRFSQGYEIIERGRNDIAAAISGAQNLSATIDQCSTDSFNFNAINCYTNALFHIRSETIFLPLQMTKRFGEMVQFVTSTRAGIANCYITVGETAAEQSLNATQTIATCLLE